MDFIKYQSLENDFIIFDFYSKKNCTKGIIFDSKKIKQLCARHTGIGADGVLYIECDSSSNLPKLTLFNSNGEPAELCLNGLRCSAHYLFKYQKFPNSFFIMMNNHRYKCEVKEVDGITLITTLVPKTNYLGKVLIKLPLHQFLAHSIDMGNPHAVIFEKIDDKKLREIGPQIENNEIFPNKTNVEFIWQEKEDLKTIKKFTMKVFERHAGLTRSCSSGAAAAVQALLEESKITPGESIEISMPGGILRCSIGNENEIMIAAPAVHAFSGVIE